MAYYLQMDGVDDNLKTPIITFTEVIFDLTIRQKQATWQTYYDSRTGGSGYLIRSTSNVDTFDFTVMSVYVDGVAGTNSTAFIPNNKRITLKIVHNPAQTDDVTILSRNNNLERVEGGLYSAKFYNGSSSNEANLVAHYDMSLGNVQDQSGNGRHATLTGGTWVQDGGGGTTHTLASSANGVSVATTALTVIPAAIQLAASAKGVGQGTANLSVLNASMLLSASAPGVSTGSAAMSVIRGLSSNKSGVAWGSASLAGLTIQLSASANGVAMGYADLISGANIVGFIRLEGKQVVSINLVGERDLHAAVEGSMNPPTVALGGVL